MPKVREFRPIFFAIPGRADGKTTRIRVHLGHPEDGWIQIRPYYTNVTYDWEIYIEQGFRSTFSIFTCTTLTAENIADILSKLADNTGHDTHIIELGAANIAKVDEALIAEAQAKNYTIR